MERGAVETGDSIEKVIAKRRARVITRAGYRSLLFRVVYVGLIAYILLTYGFLITQSKGQGMFPAVIQASQLGTILAMWISTRKQQTWAA